MTATLQDLEIPSYWRSVWLRFRKNKMAISGLVILFSLSFMTVLGPHFSEYTYDEIHLPLKNQPPSREFWFGTDELGRDVFTRIWYGARISLTVGLSAAMIDLIIGVFWGSTAAFFGGGVDRWMVRVMDLLYSLPYLLVVISITVVLGSGLFPIIVALSLIGWITIARIVRGQILQLKQQDFALAAKALGAGPWRILFRHLLPNAIPSIVVTVTLSVPSAIFAEAFLSFLGLGIQAPMSSWGVMANDGLGALQYYPWRLFFPAFFISLTLLAFNLVGDGLSDAIAPRMRK